MYAYIYIYIYIYIYGSVRVPTHSMASELHEHTTD